MYSGCAVLRVLLRPGGGSRKLKGRSHASTFPIRWIQAVRHWHRWRRYRVSIRSCASSLGEHLSFSFDFLAVFVAAWTGGMWPAIVTAVISALVGNFFFTDPYLSLGITSVEELLDMVIFVAVSVVIGMLSELSLRLLERLKKAEQEKDNFMATVARVAQSALGDLLRQFIEPHGVGRAAERSARRDRSPGEASEFTG